MDCFGVEFAVVIILVGDVSLGKVRLLLVVRASGCRIESVPLRRLRALSEYRKLRWHLDGDWLILEGF